MSPKWSSTRWESFAATLWPTSSKVPRLNWNGLSCTVYHNLDGGFKHFLIFTSTWGDDPSWPKLTLVCFCFNWIGTTSCFPHEARNRRSLWRTSCRLISEQRRDMLLAIENRPLEKIRKGDPYWKPSILLSMLVFGVYESQYRSAMLLQLHTVALLFDFPCPVAIMVNIPVISMVM